MGQIMSGKRRELMHCVMDGDFRIITFLHHVDGYRRCDEVLTWLVRNKITGKVFIEWSQFHFGHSLMEPIRYIRDQIDKEREAQPILFGRDVM